MIVDVQLGVRLPTLPAPLAHRNGFASMASIYTALKELAVTERVLRVRSHG